MVSELQFRIEKFLQARLQQGLNACINIALNEICGMELTFEPADKGGVKPLRRKPFKAGYSPGPFKKEVRICV